jgi:hypothetical protein
MKKLPEIIFCQIYNWNVKYYLSIDKENSAQTAALCVVLLLITNICSLHILFERLFRIIIIDSMATAMILVFAIGILLYFLIYYKYLSPKKYLKTCFGQNQELGIGGIKLSSGKVTWLYILFSLALFVVSIFVSVKFSKQAAYKAIGIESIVTIILAPILIITGIIVHSRLIKRGKQNQIK